MNRFVCLVPLIAVLAGTALIADNPGSAESVCQRQDIIFCDDWEDGDHVGWGWESRWECGSGGDDACIEGVGGFESANALKCIIPENSESACYPDRNVSVNVRTNPIHMRWYIKYSEGFVFMPGYSDGEKMAYLLSDGSNSLDWRMMLGAQAPGYDDRSRFQVTVSSIGHEPVWTHNTSATRWLTSGRWYCMETMLIGGDPGQSNGKMKLWVDDTLYFDHSNMQTKTDGDPITRVQFTPWYGGNPGPSHPQQSVSYDNIVVATQRIGCAGAGSGGSGGSGTSIGNVTGLERTDTVSAP